ncbi:hypothetical protein ACQ86N_37680 [Puia sp. P3]|uniref:hypothetical protein n=1 Tax=Puia sp. P3 TaxID=3423952 RepID=UPI003D6658B8
MYLILDLHAAPGGRGNDLNISDRDPSKPSLWQSLPNQQKTIALWRRRPSATRTEPFIGGYDIINEPNWGFDDPKDTGGRREIEQAASPADDADHQRHPRSWTSAISSSSKEMDLEITTTASFRSGMTTSC